MEQYKRNSESELTRMIIGESHQENIENDLKKELEELNWYRSSDSFGDLIALNSYNKWVVEKVERVLEEMKAEDDYRDYDFEDDDWTDDELFDCVDDDSEEVFGHDDWEMEDDKYDKAYLQEDEEENYFPKHLEYDLDKFGYPSRIHCEENENDWFYQEVKVRESLEKEESSQLMEMLRVRHHLSLNKRI
jgi:hypothetical protein